MITMDIAAAKDAGRNFISIRDAVDHYKTSFWVEDGKEMTVTHPDGSTLTQKCAYLDAHHFNFGHTCFHIDQFAEHLLRYGVTCAPVEYVTDLNLYRKSYFDRNLTDDNNRIIPYRSIIGFDLNSNRDPQKILAVCTEAAKDRQVAIWERGDRRQAGEVQFYSIPYAWAMLLPQFNLSLHERNLVSAVFDAHNRDRIRITQQQFDSISPDYKGVYEDIDHRHPEWKGRRVAFLPGHGTTLFIEGVSFEIDAGKKASLSHKIQNADKKRDMRQNQSQKRLHEDITR